LGDAILPAELLVLPEELAGVDPLLNDPALVAPFAPFFDARVCRPSIPMETCLRLMFLRFRYRLGLRDVVPGRARFDLLAAVRRIPFYTRFLIQPC
jgi:IS5 family transposase